MYHIGKLTYRPPHPPKLPKEPEGPPEYDVAIDLEHVLDPAPPKKDPDAGAGAAISVIAPPKAPEMSTQPESQNNQHSNPTLGFQTQDLCLHHHRYQFQSFFNGTANTATVRARSSQPAQAIPDHVAPSGGA